MWVQYIAITYYMITVYIAIATPHAQINTLMDDFTGSSYICSYINM